MLFLGIVKMSESSQSSFRKWLLPGLIGYNLGVCLAILIVGSLSIRRSIVDIRTRNANESGFHGSESEGSTTTSIVNPIFEEIEDLIKTNPEGAIQLLESEMQFMPNDLEFAIGLNYLAEAQLMLGNNEKADEHYHQMLNLLPPLLGKDMSILDTSQIYTNLIIGSIGVEDFSSAQLYYDEMKTIIIPLLSDMEDVPAMAGSYWNLVYAASQQGDYSEAESYYASMSEQLDALLADLVNSKDIGETYTYLILAATHMWDTDSIEKYNQELVYRLVPLRDGFINTEEKAQLNKYIGNSEFALGHYQISAVYYKELVNYERTARNIYRLAKTYELGGDHGCTYLWYQELIAMEQTEEVSVYKDIAEDAVARLEEGCKECGVPDCP